VDAAHPLARVGPNDQAIAAAFHDAINRLLPVATQAP
jgi:hypothetical protein